MKRLFLSLLLISPWNIAKEGVVKAKYTYTMSLYYETNMLTDQVRSAAFINGKRLTCICGNDPMLIMIVYGHVQGFCFIHIPEIDINGNCDCRLKETR